MSAQPGSVTQRQGSALTLALFGEPLGHSLSPLLHQAHATWAGRPLSYHLLPSSAEGFAMALARAQDLGVTGANVTAPHKRLACEACQLLSPSAEALQVVNTLSWTAQGLHGHNTDLDGLELSLTHVLHALQRSPEELTFRLIGAGGSARPALWAGLNLGFKSFELVSRAQVNAQVLAEWAYDSHPAGASVDFSALSADGPWPQRLSPTLCVLATPPLTSSELHQLCSTSAYGASAVAIFDLNYGTRARSSARWAKERGALYLDGALMLAEQGRRSFERWTGLLPPLERSLSALTS